MRQARLFVLVLGVFTVAFAMLASDALLVDCANNATASPQTGENHVLRGGNDTGIYSEFAGPQSDESQIVFTTMGSSSGPRISGGLPLPDDPTATGDWWCVRDRFRVEWKGHRAVANNDACEWECKP